MLIDSGSTHNFIKTALAEQLGLPFTSTVLFRVYISSGDYLVCKFQCPQVALCLQDYRFIIDLFLLPIQGPDVVLGIQWLQQLGRVSHDYAVMTMEFFWNEKPVTLQSDFHASPELLSLHQFQTLIHGEDFHSLFELHPMPSNDLHNDLSISSTSDIEFPSTLSASMLQVLQQYSDLLQAPASPSSF